MTVKIPDHVMQYIAARSVAEGREPESIVVDMLRDQIDYNNHLIRESEHITRK
jgi:hypothetical protein